MRTMLPLDFDILESSKSSQPWAVTALGSGKSGGEQKCGPVDAVEADDLFADEVQIGGPEFLERGVSSSRAIAERGHVVRQRVEPHVDDVLLLREVGGGLGDGDAPGEAGARDAEIFEPAAQKAQHFVLAAISGVIESVPDSMRSMRGCWKALSLKKKFSSVTSSSRRPQSGQGVPTGASTKASSETQ